MSPDGDEAGMSSAAEASPTAYASRPVFAMVPLSQITPTTIPDLSSIVRQIQGPYESHSRKKYYSVTRGHLRTIVASWEECKLITDGHHLSLFKGFNKFNEAVDYLRDD